MYNLLYKLLLLSIIMMTVLYGLFNSLYGHVLRTFILTLLTMLRVMTFITPNVFVLFFK